MAIIKLFLLLILTSFHALATTCQDPLIGINIDQDITQLAPQNCWELDGSDKCDCARDNQKIIGPNPNEIAPIRNSAQEKTIENIKRDTKKHLGSIINDFLSLEVGYNLSDEAQAACSLDQLLLDCPENSVLQVAFGDKGAENLLAMAQCEIQYNIIGQVDEKACPDLINETKKEKACVSPALSRRILAKRVELNLIQTQIEMKKDQINEFTGHPALAVIYSDPVLKKQFLEETASQISLKKWLTKDDTKKMVSEKFKKRCETQYQAIKQALCSPANKLTGNLNEELTNEEDEFNVGFADPEPEQIISYQSKLFYQCSNISDPTTKTVDQILKDHLPSNLQQQSDVQLNDIENKICSKISGPQDLAKINSIVDQCRTQPNQDESCAYFISLKEIIDPTNANDTDPTLASTPIRYNPDKLQMSSQLARIYGNSPQLKEEIEVVNRVNESAENQPHTEKIQVKHKKEETVQSKLKTVANENNSQVKQEQEIPAPNGQVIQNVNPNIQTDYHQTTKTVKKSEHNDPYAKQNQALNDITQKALDGMAKLGEKQIDVIKDLSHKLANKDQSANTTVPSVSAGKNLANSQSDAQSRSNNFFQQDNKKNFVNNPQNNTQNNHIVDQSQFDNSLASTTSNNGGSSTTNRTPASIGATTTFSSTTPGHSSVQVIPKQTTQDDLDKVVITINDENQRIKNLDKQDYQKIQYYLENKESFILKKVINKYGKKVEVEAKIIIGSNNYITVVPTNNLGNDQIYTEIKSELEELILLKTVQN